MEMISKISLAFTEGGIWMWLILALQVVSIAIIIERAIFLYKNRNIGEALFANGYEDIIRKGQLKEALVKLKTEMVGHPIAGVMESGIIAAMNCGGKEEIQGKMDEVLMQENSRLEKRTGFLAMLANVGTLTGLLGTIVGMIKSFSAVAHATPVEKATLLSSGISEAMNTTAYGLVMAIPALIMFAVLNNRANQLSEDINQGSLKVFNWLSFAYSPIEKK